MSQSSARKTRRTVKGAAKKTSRTGVERAAADVKRQRDNERIVRKGVTSAADWRRGRQPVFVPLPSGNICKAINKGMDAFLKAGKIPNALMPIISQALASGEGRPRSAKQIGQDAMEDVAMLEAAIDLSNVITCECVVDPVIRPVPMRLKKELEKPRMAKADREALMLVPENREEIPVGERDFDDGEEFLWVDETDLNDRFFIMNWVMGGTQDVDQFRQELADVVDDLSAGEDDEPEAE